MLNRHEIKKVIADLSELPLEVFEEEQHLADLLVDSFAIIDLSIALQEELKIIFTQEDLAKLVTLGDLADLVHLKLENASHVRHG